MQKENIKVKGYKGKWYVVDDTYFRGDKVYLLESETFGDEVPCLIVTEGLRVLHDDVWNGFLDLRDL